MRNQDFLKVPVEGLDVQVSESLQIIRIEGVSYSFEIFRSWGAHGLPVGSHFEIIGKKGEAFGLRLID